MLYTRKGDNGTTKLFYCRVDTRLSKSCFIFEVLGTLDELNCSIGYAKVLSRESSLELSMADRKVPYEEILEIFQQDLFCIQAELGGADIHVSKEQVFFLEKVIYEIETVLPPLNSFVVAGGGMAGAYLDIARTVARRVERESVALYEKKDREIGYVSLEFLNRLSSVLYALARFANYQAGYTERKPDYK